MRWLIRILGVLVVGVLLFVSAIFWFTADVVETADEFFAKVAADEWDQARDHLSEAFIASAPDEAIRAFLADAGADQYLESSFSGRYVSTSGATLEGYIRTGGGEEVELKIDFVREDGNWRIYHIERMSPGIGSTRAAALKLPALEDSAALVKATTLGFAKGLKAGDLGPFHSGTAPEFRDQIPLDRFNELFAEFLNRQVDLTPLSQHEPLFTREPALSGDGILHLVGHFPTRPSLVEFDYKYVHRRQGWQLLGIHLNLKPVSEDTP